MNNMIKSVANFLDHNFYGFLLLLLAAYFYKIHNGEAGVAFFGAGTTLMGVNKLVQPPQETVKVTANPPTATVTTGTENA